MLQPFPVGRPQYLGTVASLLNTGLYITGSAFFESIKRTLQHIREGEEKKEKQKQNHTQEPMSVE